MSVFMHKSAQTLLLMLVIFHFLVLITCSHVTFSTKVDFEVVDPIIKCGECPCENPCSQQLPTPSPPPPSPPPPSPPPPTQNCDQPSLSPPPPPPPRFVYVTGLKPPPPPPRFVYMSGSPGKLNPANPFNLQVYSNAAHSALEAAVLILILYATFQVLVYW